MTACTAPARVSWERLAQRISDAIGLHFPAGRLTDLQRGVTAAAEAQGEPDLPCFVDQLLTLPLSDAGFHRLARQLTVGETYFFRERAALDALTKTVLPELIASRHGRDQRLRLWSAGCASGEEAYTLAILLHQALPNPDGWKVEVLATDLNSAALQRAKGAVYGPWSFRGVPLELQERYFIRRPDGRLEVRPAIRKLVRFAPLNLVQDSFPGAGADGDAPDVICCRNVLMYFSPLQMQEVASRLYRCLPAHGWLVVSPCETSQTLFKQFETVPFPGAILYRKQEARACAIRATSPRAVATPAPRSQPMPGARGGPTQMVTVPAVAGLAARARMLADRGDLAAALAASQRWTAAAPLDPSSHHLLALICLALGHPDLAQASLRRAIFLQPDCVPAQLSLGHAARAQGKPGDARRHYQRVLRLLNSYLPGDLVPGTEGLSAGGLCAMVRSLLGSEAV